MWKKAAWCLGGAVAGATLTYLVSEIIKSKSRTKNEDINEEEEDFIPEEEEEEEEDVVLYDPNAKINPEDACAIIFIRKDIRMGRGKSIAQCGHAIIGIFQKTLEVYPEIAIYWAENNFPKYFYYSTGLESMNKIKALAAKNLIPYSKIVDAGRTQLEPGTATVIAIGPISKSQVPEYTEGLSQIK